MTFAATLKIFERRSQRLVSGSSWRGRTMRGIENLGVKYDALIQS